MKKVLTILLLGTLCFSCQRSALNPRYGMYYWRTTMGWESDDARWADSIGVETLYLRLFDVVRDGADPRLGMRPEATLRFGDVDRSKVFFASFRRVVPVVFIAPDVITRDNAGKMPQLAAMLLGRIDQMCELNGLGRLSEVQIDFDWTKSNGAAYFSLLQALADALHREGRTLSTTIRLHQLALQVPPVDRGVLMCYNTGKIKDPDEVNSILTKESVTPYLPHLKDYALPLSLALPQFGWNVVFHQRQFSFIAPGLELSDTTQFAAIDATHYRARTYQAVPRALSVMSEGHVRIFPGDIVRREDSSDALNREVLEEMHSLRPDIADEVIYYRN